MCVPLYVLYHCMYVSVHLSSITLTSFSFLCIYEVKFTLEVPALPFISYIWYPSEIMANLLDNLLPNYSRKALKIKYDF